MSEMGDGDSDDDFFNKPVPTLAVREKIKYDYKFESSSDDEEKSEDLVKPTVEVVGNLTLKKKKTTPAPIQSGQLEPPPFVASWWNKQQPTVNDTKSTNVSNNLGAADNQNLNPVGGGSPANLPNMGMSSGGPGMNQMASMNMGMGYAPGPGMNTMAMRQGMNPMGMPPLGIGQGMNSMGGSGVSGTGMNAMGGFGPGPGMNMMGMGCGPIQGMKPMGMGTGPGPGIPPMGMGQGMNAMRVGNAPGMNPMGVGYGPGPGMNPMSGGTGPGMNPMGVGYGPGPGMNPMGPGGGMYNMGGVGGSSTGGNPMGGCGPGMNPMGGVGLGMNSMSGGGPGMNNMGGLGPGMNMGGGGPGMNNMGGGGPGMNMGVGGPGMNNMGGGGPGMNYMGVGGPRMNCMGGGGPGMNPMGGGGPGMNMGVGGPRMNSMGGCGPGMNNMGGGGPGMNTMGSGPRPFMNNMGNGGNSRRNRGGSGFDPGRQGYGDMGMDHFDNNYDDDYNPDGGRKAGFRKNTSPRFPWNGPPKRFGSKSSGSRPFFQRSFPPRSSLSKCYNHGLKSSNKLAETIVKDNTNEANAVDTTDMEKVSNEDIEKSPITKEMEVSSNAIISKPPQLRVPSDTSLPSAPCKPAISDLEVVEREAIPPSPPVDNAITPTSNSEPPPLEKQIDLSAMERLSPRQATENVSGFKNDGSFLEMFRKLKENATSDDESQDEKKEIPPSKKPVVPKIVGKRRGGRVLKTGVVEKIKKKEITQEKESTDAWTLYMAEVKKYREENCEEEGKTRALVK